MSKQSFKDILERYVIFVKSHRCVFLLRDYTVYMYAEMGKTVPPPCVATMYVSLDIPRKEVDLAFGQTFTPYRGYGFGTALRAMITLAARESGFDRVTQLSAQVNKSQYKSILNEPISGIIMKKLGFTESHKYNPNYKQLKIGKENPNNLRKLRLIVAGLRKQNKFYN